MPVGSESELGPAPADWPGPGSIDLAIHDRPHDSSTMEWWYVNAHLSTSDGRPFSMCAAFFRVDVSPARAETRTYAHFLTWALIDPLAGRYVPVSLLDPKAPRIALEELAAGRGPRDPRLADALREVLDKGRLPLPDRLLGREAIVSMDTLSLDYDGNRFTKLPDGRYEVDVTDDAAGVACRLRFTLTKSVVRHGDAGIVRGLEAEDMFYYFSPRCRVEGVIRIDGESYDAVGDGWYDHEFGAAREGASRTDIKLAWNWLAAQLDNGYEISAFAVVEKAQPSVSHGRWVILIDPSGRCTAITDFTFEPHGNWTSTTTLNEYPMGYRLAVPEAGIELDLSAVLPSQELITMISAPGFWEGLMNIRGSMKGRPVGGRAFVERSGARVVETRPPLGPSHRLGYT